MRRLGEVEQHMQTEFEKTSSVSAKLSITLDVDTVNAEFKKFFKDMAKKANIPGFRQGKAPRHLLEAKYGDAAQEEVVEKLINGSLADAMMKHEVMPVARPTVDYDTLKKDESFSYTAEVETRPEFENVKYEGLKVEKIEAAIEENALEDELKRLQEQAVQVVPVLDRDIVQAGDVVVMNFEGTQGGVPIEGAKGEATLYEIGSDDYLPGMSDALIGASVPGSRSVPVDFPDDYSMQKWSGLKATFSVEMLELKKKELPEIDDDFAKDIGQESLDALKESITTRLQEAADTDAKRDQRDALLKALVAENPFEVPPSMVAEQVDRMINDAVERIKQMMGGDFPLDGLDIEGLREKNREDAEHIVRSGLLLSEVIQAAGIEVNDTDIEEEIERMANNAGEQATRLRLYYQGEGRDQVRYRLVEDRAINMLSESAGISVPDTGKSEETSASEEE